MMEKQGKEKNAFDSYLDTVTLHNHYFLTVVPLYQTTTENNYALIAGVLRNTSKCQAQSE